MEAVRIKDVLLVLTTICEQQQIISERLGRLIETLKMPSEPVEPVLELMLKPVTDGLGEMRSLVTSSDASEKRNK